VTVFRHLLDERPEPPSQRATRWPDQRDAAPLGLGLNDILMLLRQPGKIGQSAMVEIIVAGVRLRSCPALTHVPSIPPASPATSGLVRPWMSAFAPLDRSRRSQINLRLIGID
jgi:hypothetical protein